VEGRVGGEGGGREGEGGGGEGSHIPPRSSSGFPSHISPPQQDFSLSVSVLKSRGAYRAYYHVCSYEEIRKDIYKNNKLNIIARKRILFSHASIRRQILWAELDNRWSFCGVRYSIVR
jgi:hypothetical protein